MNCYNFKTETKRNILNTNKIDVSVSLKHYPLASKNILASMLETRG